LNKYTIVNYYPRFFLNVHPQKHISGIREIFLGDFHVGNIAYMKIQPRPKTKQSCRGM